MVRLTAIENIMPKHLNPKQLAAVIILNIAFIIFAWKIWTYFYLNKAPTMHILKPIIFLIVGAFLIYLFRDKTS